MGTTHNQIGATPPSLLNLVLTDAQESSTPSTTVAHLYTLDHLLQTLFHYLFYLDYWYNIPHDGRRNANSQAQQDLINLAASRNEIIDPATQETAGMDELRKALAGEIWRTEKVFAGWTLVVGFFVKVRYLSSCRCVWQGGMRVDHIGVLCIGLVLLCGASEVVNVPRAALDIKSESVADRSSVWRR